MFLLFIKTSLLTHSSAFSSACLIPMSGRWPELDRMSQSTSSAGRGALFGEFLEEILVRLSCLEYRVEKLDQQLNMPSGAATTTAHAHLDQAVQAEPTCVDKAVQTSGSMPLQDWLDLLVGEEERRLDDPVEGAGSPVASTGTVATTDAIDTPPRRRTSPSCSASCDQLFGTPARVSSLQLQCSSSSRLRCLGHVQSSCSSFYSPGFTIAHCSSSLRPRRRLRGCGARVDAFGGRKDASPGAGPQNEARPLSVLC